MVRYVYIINIIMCIQLSVSLATQGKMIVDTDVSSYISSIYNALYFPPTVFSITYFGR